MKKRIISAVLCVIFLMSGTGPVLAGARLGTDLTISVGTKLWYNSWNKWLFNTGNGNLLSNRSEDNEMSLLPSLSLKYKKFFLTGSWMLPTEYTFPGHPSIGNTFKMEREEMDVNAGYYVTPSLGLTGGYKAIKQTLGEGTAGGFIDYTGPTLGILGSAGIGNGLAIYGNAAYGFMEMERNSGTVDATYTSSELGLAYIPTPMVSLTLGYKYQVVKSECDSANPDKTCTDLTNGFLLGANLIF
ncbi:MAG: hypothetical protein ACE5GF_06075 [Thermodesulfobacteriota bacterium]